MYLEKVTRCILASVKISVGYGFEVALRVTSRFFDEGLPLAQVDV